MRTTTNSHAISSDGPAWKENARVTSPSSSARSSRPSGPEGGGVFVDATLGLGGHAEALLEASPAVRVVGIDRDPEALALAKMRLARFGDRLVTVRGRHEDLAAHLDALGIAASRASSRTSASRRCSSTAPSGGSRS